MMPSSMYTKKNGGEKTWDSIAEFMVEDLTYCFYNGVQVLP